MNKKITYSEKLRDPRWQKKRLEILSRDKFQCRCCGSENETLMVHHIQYIKGSEPWEYPDELLYTLCESCHEEEHMSRSAAENRLLQVLKTKGYYCKDIEELIIFLENVHTIFPYDVLFSSLTWFLRKGTSDLTESYLESLSTKNKNTEID